MNSTMGNRSSSSSTRKALPIDSLFKLPADIPVWPQGDGFARGIIDLGNLQVSQVSSFNRIWTTFEGGPHNAGATFFEPASIPEGFSMLGCYAQPNNKPLFGWVLVAKSNSSAKNGALTKPVDYTLVWSSKSLDIKQDNTGYVWLPIPPDGYKAVGHVITTSPEKPSLDRIRCVGSDLTDQTETHSWIWGPGKSSTESSDGFNVYNTRPTSRRIKDPSVPVGTFLAQNGANNSTTISLPCLKNNKLDFFSMPNLPQAEALMEAYAPLMYLHHNEKYLPSSVKWYFTNGALLYTRGEESKPVAIDPPSGSNLPQGGDNDGAYWIDLPEDKTNKERIKRGDLQSFQAYLHIKPMFGATFTDISTWIFYPFNGPSRAKVGVINSIPLGQIGEHIGDWEHVTLRISNFNGGLKSVYFSQHSGGQWVDASELEFQPGKNKPVAYSSLNGHALYSKPGLVLQGTNTIGIRNDTEKSEKVVDLGKGFEVVAGEYLGSAITVPAWLNYRREWGPKISYKIEEELDKVEKVLPANLRSGFEKFRKSLPNELFGEEGPTGPKLKASWDGDER